MESGSSLFAPSGRPVGAGGAGFRSRYPSEVITDRANIACWNDLIDDEDSRDPEIMVGRPEDEGDVPRVKKYYRAYDLDGCNNILVYRARETDLFLLLVFRRPSIIQELGPIVKESPTERKLRETVTRHAFATEEAAREAAKPLRRGIDAAFAIARLHSSDLPLQLKNEDVIVQYNPHPASYSAAGTEVVPRSLWSKVRRLFSKKK